MPDTFFSIKHQLRPIASLSVSAPSAILIYLLTIGGFVGCWLFYSLPNPPQTVTVIQSEWQKAGYECNPLQKDQNFGLMISYNTCIKQYRLPSETTILGMTSDNGATFNDANDLCFYPLEATFYCAKQCSHGDGKGLSKAGCIK